MGAHGLRSLARWAIAGAFGLTGLSDREAAAHRSRGDFLVLCYHSIAADAAADPAGIESGLAVTRDTFRRQIQLVASTYEVVRLQDAVLTSRQPAPGRPRCAITFDDGWADNAEHAWPVLMSHGLPATTFLPTGHVGAGTPLPSRVLLDLLAFDAAKRGDRVVSACEAHRRMKRQGARAVAAHIARLRPLVGDLALPSHPLLTWEQVNAGLAAGMTFGSHSVWHRGLTELDDSELQAEVRESKREIEQRTGRPVRSFCYPDGDWDERARGAVAASGYELACTTEAGWVPARADPLLLPRCDVTEAASSGPFGGFSATVFSAFLSGATARAKRRLRRDSRGGRRRQHSGGGSEGARRGRSSEGADR